MRTDIHRTADEARVAVQISGIGDGGVATSIDARRVGLQVKVTGGIIYEKRGVGHTVLWCAAMIDAKRAINVVRHVVIDDAVGQIGAAYSAAAAADERGQIAYKC